MLEFVAALSPLLVERDCEEDDDDADDSDADVFDEVDGEPVVVITGPWLTPSTRTVGLLAGEFISMVGDPPDEPNTNGIVACVEPFTVSTVMFGNPF